MKRILLLFTFAASFSFVHGQVQNYSVGQTVADFTVTDIHGQTHNLYDYTSQGKYVMLDFFFVACGPCQATVPNFTDLYNKYGCNEGDLVCICINTGEDNDAAVQSYETTYAGTNPAPAVSGDGGSSPVNTAFNPAAYPTYCLIGSDNKLANADIWPASSVADLEAGFPAGFSPTVMSCATNINEVEAISDIKVFPSPATENATLDFYLQNDQELTVQIVNLVGEVVKEVSNTNFKAGANRLNLELNDVAAGNYMVQLLNQSVNKNLKLQVVK